MIAVKTSVADELLQVQELLSEGLGSSAGAADGV